MGGHCTGQQLTAFIRRGTLYAPSLLAPTLCPDHTSAHSKHTHLLGQLLEKPWAAWVQDGMAGLGVQGQRVALSINLKGSPRSRAFPEHHRPRALGAACCDVRQQETGPFTHRTELTVDCIGTTQNTNHLLSTKAKRRGLPSAWHCQCAKRLTPAAPSHSALVLLSNSVDKAVTPPLEAAACRRVPRPKTSIANVSGKSVAAEAIDLRCCAGRRHACRKAGQHHSRPLAAETAQGGAKNKHVK